MGLRRFGRRAILVMVLLLWVSLAYSQIAGEILTNELVIKLVAAGFSESVIIEKIQSTPSRFDVGIDAMIALKGAGVPEPVIQAMVRTQRLSRPATPDPLGPAPPVSPEGAPVGEPPASPMPSVMPGPGLGRPGFRVFPVFSPVPVEVKDTVIYIKEDKQLELEYTRGRVKQSGFMVYTSKLVLRDARAQLRIAEERPTFYVGANPTDVALIRFKSDPKDNDRTITVGKAMFIPYWSESKPYIDSDDAVPIDFEKLPSGYYKVTPKQALPTGEYGFLREGGGAGRAYDFGRD